MKQPAYHVLNEYQKRKHRKYLLIVSGFILMFILAIFFTTLGTTDTTFSDVAGSIFRAFTSGGKIFDKQDKIIVLLRLPEWQWQSLQESGFLQRELPCRQPPAIQW